MLLLCSFSARPIDSNIFQVFSHIFLLFPHFLLRCRTLSYCIHSGRICSSKQPLCVSEQLLNTLRAPEYFLVASLLPLAHPSPEPGALGRLFPFRKAKGSSANLGSGVTPCPAFPLLKKKKNPRGEIWNPGNVQDKILQVGFGEMGLFPVTPGS